MSVVAEFESFLASEVPKFQARWDDPASWEARVDWQRTLNTGRWAAPAWPEAHGGRGLEPHEVVVVEEMLGAQGFPIIAGVLGINNVGPTLIAWGTDEQKSHLPAILTGEEMWCQGFSEPGAGSDLASLRTKAVRDGNHFVVNGQKIWTSNGTHATHMELLVRTDPQAPKHKGISALTVDLSSPGIDIRPIRQINGEQEFAEVFFTDVGVPVENLLGPENQGWRVTMTTLGHERSAIAALARRQHGDVAALVQQRLATTSSPALRDDLMRRYIETFVAANMGEQMLARVAEGEQPGAEQTVIKLLWSETGQRVDATRLALAGVNGVLGHEPDPAKEYLTGRALTIAGGTTQVLKNIMAERVLGLPKE
ncbi:acyl-CoA dehydrogenase family protein [Gordonia alkanivorans]|uniref:acyl-CoA dehydrogenase family protein n=1 Tax=Gordonia alkanivorans TaxID=84096 RepID=UPI0024498569|nr:acyl-CoA dehydrogenase family protein [Gordonia alkanivorans]MDH3047243.1 acyl-CoA dehydrogenase family protein [Gordonia alkanivorans]